MLTPGALKLVMQSPGRRMSQQELCRLLMCASHAQVQPHPLILSLGFFLRNDVANLAFPTIAYRDNNLTNSRNITVAGSRSPVPGIWTLILRTGLGPSTLSLTRSSLG